MSNITPDKTTYRSDILSVLENIETLFRTSQNVLSSHARNGLLFSVAMESRLLALKLATTASRWRVHIPFKEACRVNFIEWAKKTEQMSQYLSDLDTDAETMEVNVYCPDKHFLLDLYTRYLSETPDLDGESEPKDRTPYYLETDMGKFILSQELLHRSLSERWLDYLEEFSELAARHIVTDAAGPSVSDAVPTAFKNSASVSDTGISVNFLECQIDDMGDEKNIRLVSSLALRELSDRLYELNRSLERSFTSDHFIRLADRILTEREYGGPDIRAKVRAEIAQWKNSTPDEEIESSREEKMRQSYENIVAMKFRRNFQAYVRNYTPDMEQKKNAIGKFLFHCRREITEEELREFMTELFRIIYLRRDQQKESVERDSAGPLPSPPAGESPADKDPDIYLSNRLSARPEACRKFYELLKSADPYICHNLNLRQRKDPSVNKYEGWTWWHLKRAFLKQGFLMSGLSDKDFFTFLSLIFPGRSYSAISKGYYRHAHGPSDGITERVKEEFRVVEEML